MEKNLGDRIKELRLEKELTQEELGNLLGVKKAAVQKYENGTVINVKNEKLTRMAEIFDCSMDYLLGKSKHKVSREREIQLNQWDEKYNKDGKLADEVHEIENQVKDGLPALTPKDEAEIARDLEAMLSSLDSKNGMAAYNDPEDDEDRELLKASLETSMRLAKQMAKKKFTPKKYRKE